MLQTHCQRSDLWYVKIQIQTSSSPVQWLIPHQVFFRLPFLVFSWDILSLILYQFVFAVLTSLTLSLKGVWEVMPLLSLGVGQFSHIFLLLVTGSQRTASGWGLPLSTACICADRGSDSYRAKGFESMTNPPNLYHFVTNRPKLLSWKSVWNGLNGTF